MTDFIELKFHIEDRTPETLPIKELISILSTLTGEIKDIDYVHLVDVRNESACPVLGVRKDRAPDVYHDIKKPKTIEKVNSGLAQHNTFGYIEFQDKKTQDNIIEFPKIDFGGIKLYEAPKTITIYDETTIKGKITSVSGRDSTVNVEIEGFEGEIYKCKIDDKRAKKLSWGDYISAQVTGEWIRLENGKWETPPYKKLTIQSYEKVIIEENASLINGLNGLIDNETFHEIQNGIRLDTGETKQ